MEMAMVKENNNQVRQRWARWYPKKQDDRILERWARACSKIYNDCRDCDSREECQDLADRLIVCMSASAMGSRRPRKQGPNESSRN